ncbi:MULTISPECIES: hypothetical protein [Streptomyces]|uniref:hypothetical protein n=1 Tax=Streptomyces TaxID=1883 RepID=UPI00117F93F2|nr:hypothetical protein [Streptomyces kasugaensis]
MRADLMPDACIIVRPARTQDRYGNPADDWPNATRTAVYGRLVARAVGRLGNGEVHTVGRTAVEQSWALILPAGTDIAARDLVEIDSGTFKVEGHPIRRRTMRREHHITASLKAVE